MFLESLIAYRAQTERHQKGEFVPVPYGNEIIICPEPITFLTQLDDYSNDNVACMQEFKKMLTKFPRLKLSQGFGAFWFNTTTKGINLRPGLNQQSEPAPVIMGDNAVHALMAGQTGSGKSVMLNDLIFNLMAEYPPWELDIYLADFKKVEFSRYMNKFVAPHVSACAATSEIRYVVSMIQYMVDCMNAREALFARLGFQKLADLRNSSEFSDLPPIVLPRMLLIVDEFQQMFLDASAKEGEQIRNMLTAIVKKGRATGLHILFASQEMSNTLSRSDLANFKIRFALNCNVGVSMDVIGNKEATRIRKGSVIYNTSDGAVENNVIYTVPFIETNVEQNQDYSYFETFLAGMMNLRLASGFRKSQKFYQEDLQAPFMDADYQVPIENIHGSGRFDSLIENKTPLTLERILSRIRSYREGILGKTEKYFDIFTLGDYVTFSNLRFDIQTLFIEYGRSRNILAVSPKIEDLAYLEKLFSYNIITSPRPAVCGQAYQHIIYSFQPLIDGMFSLSDALGQDIVSSNPEDIEKLQVLLMKRNVLHQLCRDSKTAYDFVIGNYRANLALAARRMSADQVSKAESEMVVICHKLFDDVETEDIPAVCGNIASSDDYDITLKHLANNLMTFYTYSKNPVEAFPPTIVWISGIDAVERIPEWLISGMKKSMDDNILFIVLASSEFDQIRQISKCCDYIFAGGNNEVIYDRLEMQYTKKDAESIALDMYIRSKGEARSFKKYKCSLGRQYAPAVPFDELLTD